MRHTKPGAKKKPQPLGFKDFTRKEGGYAGSVIAELDGGDEVFLRDVSRRIDRLLLG